MLIFGLEDHKYVKEQISEKVIFGAREMPRLEACRLGKK